MSAGHFAGFAFFTVDYEFIDMNWNDYQENVAAFFRSIGATAETNASVNGVRGTHMVDVLIHLKHFGVDVTWIVECKLWKTSVPKEKILTLQQIVQDVGADRGFLMSESGFQSGAIKTATTSNITLSSLRDLQDMAAEELMKMRLKWVSIKLDELTQRHYVFMPLDKFNKIQVMDIVLESLAKMLLIRTELFKVHGGRFPFFLVNETVNNVDEFVKASELILGAADGEIHKIEQNYNDNLVAGLKVFTETNNLINELLTSAHEIAQSQSSPEQQNELRLSAVTIMKKIGDAMIDLRGYTNNTSIRYLHAINRVLIDELYLDLMNENLTIADVRKTSDHIKKACHEFERVFQPIATPPTPNKPE
ncbi:hypothetical protein ABIC45_002953 [Mucilaginibacter rubeus]|uniref:restriction endonuclease n=1 Tax=Mucilaginibacter rubeus TaxID=2027860 RepID=UPI0033980B1A